MIIEGVTEVLCIDAEPFEQIKLGEIYTVDKVIERHGFWFISVKGIKDRYWGTSRFIEKK